MTPQAVAAAPKDLTPRHTPPSASASGGFAQLVGGGGDTGSGSAATQAQTQAQGGDSTAASGEAQAAADAVANRSNNPTCDSGSAQARGKTKAKSDDASAALTATSALQPQALSVAVAAAPGETQGAAPATDAASIAPGQAPAAGATANSTRTAMPESAAAQNAALSDGGANLSPGATALNARVVAGPPNYISQPNSALAGLWHHAGATAPSATGPVSPGDAASGAGTDGDGANPVQGSASAKAGASPNGGVTTMPPGVPGVDNANSTSDLTTSNGATAVDGAAPSTAITVSLPGTTAAPTAAATPTASTILPTPSVIPAVAQVAINLTQAVQNGTDRIEIQLKPASLGTIAVKLDLTHDGRITAVISADRSDTLNLLRQDSGQLQQALRDAGLQADSGSLSFNLRGDPQSFFQDGASTRGGDATAANPVAAVTAHADFARSRRHAGALDIQV